jgi:glycosyltransferase involved in cell wall biosynthesis
MKLRAWIIGNAPSIADLDMTRLKDEITFSFNRAYLAYEEWGWYPTYYCVIDSRMLRQTTEDINWLIKNSPIKAFYLHEEGSEGIIKADNVHLVSFDKYAQNWGFDPKKFKYCGDVAAFSLQVAYSIGYRELYIAGVDMSWGDFGETGPDKDTDHFRPDYETEKVRMSKVYAEGHQSSWKKSIEEATSEPYNLKMTVTTPDSKLRELLPYKPFETVPMQVPIINYELWKEKFKPIGISGCFRLRNESQFMTAAIESFLPFIDEAVLLVQPSSDETAEIAETLAKKHPKKVRVYYYPYIVDWIDTQGFYKNDTDKPGHLVHMSNYALSKCRYRWIAKVEGDVIALPTFSKISDAITKDPYGTHYYGFVILNLAGEDFDKFSKEHPRNECWDEAVFNNDPDLYHFYRKGKWETINIHDHKCMGWAGVHLKRCKKGLTEGWNGETYWKLTRANLTKSLDAYAENVKYYPGEDDPHGVEELFTTDWKANAISEMVKRECPLVSVIVPTYNRPKMLERALRSIQAQSVQDYEIIVVNDAGEDVSEIVAKFDKASYYEHEENKGLAGSRNTGLDHATGKYVCFLDDDDVLFPVHFQVLVNELDKGWVEAVYTDAYRWENEVYLRRTLSADYSLTRLYSGCPFYVMCVMLRRDVFNGHRFDETLPSHEDYDMWLTLSREIEFKHLPFITAAYSHRGDGSQISHKPYHKGYFDKVRKKHGVEDVPDYRTQKPKNRTGRYRVLRPFTGIVFGTLMDLPLGKILDIEADVAYEYERAGYVEEVGK